MKGKWFDFSKTAEFSNETEKTKKDKFQQSEKDSRIFKHFGIEQQHGET